jgi:hypothetical protein
MSTSGEHNPDVASADSALYGLDGAAPWLNSEPLTAGGLAGTVVLADICTYSCVNWLRTLPYVRAWHERYRDRGFTVVGVHSPEFSFEHDLDRVRNALGELDVPYPVVLDNAFSVWRSLDNQYWPAVYLVDGEGRVRYTHFGEEAYDETERAIQDLLGVDEDTVDLAVDGFSLAADWGSLRSPETYLGYARGERRTDGPAAALALNEWALHGAWDVGDEVAESQAADGAIAYRFGARDVNLVLGAAGDPVPFTVRLDGDPPGDAHGVDADAEGTGAVDESRMYQLVRQGAAAERTFEITFHAPGARAYVFTFG